MVEAGALNWMYLHLVCEQWMIVLQVVEVQHDNSQHYKVGVQHDDQQFDDILEVRLSVHDDNQHDDIVQVHHADMLEVHHDMQVQLGNGLLLVQNKNEAAAVKLFAF